MLVAFTGVTAPLANAATIDVLEFEAQYTPLPNDALIKQAVRGDNLAQFELGNRLATGRGYLPVNQSAAAMWFNRAAQRGYPGSPSIHPLPNAPLRIDRTISSQSSSPPIARLAPPDASELRTLTLSLDGSASSDDLSITRGVWDIRAGDAINGVSEALVTPTGPDQAQIQFPGYGTWFVTLIIMNEQGWLDHTTRKLVLEEPIAVPGIPQNLSPMVSAEVNETDTVTFTWLEEPLADSYDFHLFERIESNAIEFVYDMLPEAVCSAGICSVTRLLTLPVADGHAWRVRARNESGVTDWSRSVFNVIEVITQPPGAPVLASPNNQAIVESGLVQSFSWIPTILASAYEFQLVNADPELLPLPEDSVTVFVPGGNCTESHCTVTVQIDFPPGSELVWRLRSLNPAGESDWISSSISVTKLATAMPELPLIVAPEDSTDLIINQVSDFLWQHDPQAATYEFHFFDNAPGPDRGARADIIGLRPQDLCEDTVCTLSQLVDLPAYANHAWRVRARNSLGVSGWTRTTFNVVELVTDPPPVPALLMPLPAALLELGSTVSFRWLPEETATQYEFHIVDTADAEFDSISAYIPTSSCASDVCAVSTELSAPLSETYQWRVRASNAAGASDYQTSPFSLNPTATALPVTPQPILPVEEFQLSEGDTVEFSWAQGPNAVNYEFHFFNNLDDSTSPDLVGLRVRDICVNNVCAIELPIALPIAEDHAWRVRGHNSLGYSQWSRSVFEVIAPITEPPAAFVLVAPSSGETVIQNSNATFSWQAALRAVRYNISISDGSDETASPHIGEVLAGSCSDELCSYTTPINLAEADNHRWQVKAINPLGESESLESLFAVGLEVIEPPQLPALVAPDVDAVFLSATTVDFQWQADGNATSYEFYMTDAVNGALPITTDLHPSDLCDSTLCTHTVELNLPVSELHTWHARVFHDDLASAWSQRSISIVDNAGSESPLASFVISGFAADASGVAPLTVSLDPGNSSDDVGIESYQWDFGDSNDPVTVTDADLIAHEYLQPGSYTVTLTVTDGAELSGTMTASVLVFDPATVVSAVDASRLLTQATFGPDIDSILEVQTLGIENWIEQQFALQGPAHLDYVQLHSNGSNREARHEVWWRDVVEGDDQLRQRVAFALSQIFVVSDTGYTLANSQYAITHYYDLLRENAFGNYRELLETVTLNPVMGLYLSMLQNAKSDPDVSTRADENYAREVLQLFSIGLYDLNLDGSTDTTPSFTQDNIEAFARVFTGWNYADAGHWNRVLFTNADLINPMRPFESFHDMGSKTLLNSGFYSAVNGGTAAAGQSARQDLEFALDNIFNHPNVGPFIARHLITKLVTSNPTGSYVSAVAGVFNDNGAGVRGDLKAVIREILLNDEARMTPAASNFGKLREPVLRFSHLWRAFNVQPGSDGSNRGEYNTISPQLMDLETVTGQAVLKSPSVFNFFQPSFAPAGPVAEQNLKAPEFELFTESNELATTNRIGRQIQQEYASNPSGVPTTSYLDFSNETVLAQDVEALLDHLDLLLLSGNMSDSLRTTLGGHLNGLDDTADGLSQRVRDAITLIMASPDYLVQM